MFVILQTLTGARDIVDGRRARCDGLRAPGSTPPSPLTAKPGAERSLGSTSIPYLSTLGTGADEDWPGGGEGSAYVISVGFCTNYSRNEPVSRGDDSPSGPAVMIVPKWVQKGGS